MLSGEIDIFDTKGKGTFTARIVRIDDEGNVAAEFTDLSSHSYMSLCMLLNAPAPVD